MEKGEEKVQVEGEESVVDEENVVGRAELREILEAAFRKGVADGKRREMKRLFDNYGFETPKSKTKLKDLRALFDNQMQYHTPGPSESHGSPKPHQQRDPRSQHPSAIVDGEYDSQERGDLPYRRGTYDSTDHLPRNSPTPPEWNMPRAYHSDGMSSQGSGQRSGKYEERRAARNWKGGGIPNSSHTKVRQLVNASQLSLRGYHGDESERGTGRNAGRGYEDDYQGKDFEITKYFGRKEGAYYDSGRALASRDGRAEGMGNLASGSGTMPHYEKKNDKSHISLGVHLRIHLSPHDARLLGRRKSKKVKTEVEEEEDEADEESESKNVQGKLFRWAVKKVLSRYGLGGEK